LSKKFYSFITLFFLILSDLISNIFAICIVFNFQISDFLYSANIFSIICLQVFWFIIFLFFNLYDSKLTLSRFDEIIKLFPIIYGSIVLYITINIFGLIDINIDHKNALTYGLLFSFILMINRFFIHTAQKYLLKKKIGLNNAIILGVNRRGFAVLESLKNQPYHGLNIKGFVQALDDPKDFDFDKSNIKKIGYENDINNIIKNEKIDDVIIALNKPNSERIMSSIVRINGAPSSIKILPDMYEVVTGLARTTQVVGTPLIDVNLNIETFYSRRLKFFFESIFAIIGIFLCLPLWLIVALLIKIDSKGPVFYRQSRSGRNGIPFNIIKFRSMVSNAESSTGPVWANKEDVRITKIGRLLRRYHIDETPQLINILRGDMSIVGPRPERPFFVEKLIETYPFYKRRLKIRPGVTGWSQINQPFDTTIEDVHQKLKYDFYYIENISFRLDIHIIFRTIWVVLRGHKK